MCKNGKNDHFGAPVHATGPKSQTLTRRSNVNRQIVSYAIQTLSSEIREYHLGIFMMFNQSNKPLHLHVEITQIFFYTIKSLSFKKM